MTQILRKSLLQFIFSGAYLLRWNDKLRPVELSEIDKQAHKMLLSCLLWRIYCEENNLAQAESIALARNIIEGGLFDYFYRLVLTDIKPPVFYRIKENEQDYALLTDYVLSELKTYFDPRTNGENIFWNRLCAWHKNTAHKSVAKDILTASHLFASNWEFSLIKPLNTFDDEMEDIDQSFKDSLAQFSNLAGMKAILNQGSSLARFASLCGQLRFQIRWTRIPRIPATAVLGHMFLVATFSYFFSVSLNCCQARCNNNFFCGLFHDLPEVLTRDIITPVKSSVPNMHDIIKKYESDALERRVFTPLRRDGFQYLIDEISFYLGITIGSEFSECYRINNSIYKVDSFIELHTKYNDNSFAPKDGLLIKICDTLAAFLECHNSIQTGVSSPQLVEARYKLKKILLAKDLPPEISLHALLADFE